MFNDDSVLKSLVDNRIIFLNGEINSDLANDVIVKLLYLDSLNHDDIKLYINSCGGDVIQGMAIIDCINCIKSEVQTICIGSAYSMGAIILMCGSKSKRKILPNSEIMIHSVLGSISGNLSSILNSSSRLNEKNKLIHSLIKEKTNLSNKTISLIMKENTFINAIDAVKYGFCDKIVSYEK